MFIMFDGVLINSEHVGYAYVFKKDENKKYKWILHIRFTNENQHGDYLELSYETKKEAEAKLKELHEMLNED